jgi:hypothetical protein
MDEYSRRYWLRGLGILLVFVVMWLAVVGILIVGLWK